MTRLKMLGSRAVPARQVVAAPPPKTTDKFYLTPDWRGLIGALIAARGRRCAKCGRENCRIFGDHIVELKDGGAALDPDNVMLLCGSCHTLKTNQARALRATSLSAPADTGQLKP